MFDSKTRCAGLSLAMFFFAISGSKSSNAFLEAGLIPLRYNLCTFDPSQVSQSSLDPRQRSLARRIWPDSFSRSICPCPIRHI